MNRSFILGMCLVSLGIAGAQVCLGQPGPSPAVCDDGGIGKPEICVRFDNLDDPPVENTDFDFLLGDPDNPGVHLITGSDGQTTREWRVWSWDDSQTQTPKNIGTITGSAQWNYEIRVLQPDGDDGGEDLQRIDLDPNGAGFFSRILDGTINGNLTGDLFLQKSSGGEGGAADGFTIKGSVLGGVTITLPRGEGFTVQGSIGEEMKPTAVVNIGDISGGDFTVETLLVGAKVYVDGSISNGNLQIGWAWVTPRFEMTIAEMGSQSQLLIGYLMPSPHTGLFDLTINSDLPSDATIDMTNVRGYFSRIDFGANDINGTIVIDTWGRGVITADDLNGTIDIKDWFDPTGTVILSGSMSGSFLVNTSLGDGSFGGDLQIAGDMTGSALIQCFKGTVGEFEEPAKIEVLGGSGIATNARILFDADAKGDIAITNDLYGAISIGGVQRSTSSIVMNVLKASGQISITGPARGDIQTTNNLAGDIFIGVAGSPSDLTPNGSIHVGGALKGDIVITGDVRHNSLETSISANKLGADGRILIDGLCDSDIIVNKGTNSTSLIRMTVGLGSNGIVLINDGDGKFDANGDIWIGSTFEVACSACCPVVCDYDDVVFDGCIHIYDDVSGSNGDLNGDITIRGCHASAANLIVTIDGAHNNNVWVDDVSCEHQPNAVYNGDCPL